MNPLMYCNNAYRGGICDPSAVIVAQAGAKGKRKLKKCRKIFYTID